MYMNRTPLTNAASGPCRTGAAGQLVCVIVGLKGYIGIPQSHTITRGNTKETTNLLGSWLRKHDGSCYWRGFEERIENFSSL